MAAIVKCDACGTCVPHDKAKHVRTHHLTSATTYNTKSIDTADICDACYDKLKKFLNGKDEDIC